MAPAPTLVTRQDPNATAGAPPSTTSDASSSTSSTVLYIAVGASLGAAAIIVLLCVLCCCYRRRHRRKASAISKPAVKPDAFTLQSQHKPPTVAPAKPSHYGGNAGYTASAEQSHALLANAAPTAEGPVPTAYTGEQYGQQPQWPPHAASSHGPNAQDPTPHRPPNALNHGDSHGHGPTISLTPPVPQQQQAPARPPKTGEAAVYFDTSMYIGTQRGRRGERATSTERGQQQQEQSDRSASREARIREV